MKATTERIALFDQWAAGYDAAVAQDHEADNFPFAGYERLLAATFAAAGARPGQRILELGVGTGNLAAHFVAADCAVYGLDFSAAMLAQARARLPQLHLAQADLLTAWPLTAALRFDRIVAAYVLHEFDLPTKIGLLRRAANHYLVSDGLILVADIAFETVGQREAAARRWADLWDEAEFYWAADEALAACAAAGLTADYRQISNCAGLFAIRRQETTRR
jgi:putative AdoMet-dependent methyltransferase